MPAYDVVIIGAGPAGMTAAIYAARANLQVLLLDKLAPGGQIINTVEIQNYTGMGTINGAELAIKMFEHTQEMGVAFEYGTVIDVKTDGNLKKIMCEEGHLFEAKTIIIATGTKAKMLGVPGEDKFAGSSISWCAICDGAHYRNKKVIVIGGGNSAVEEAIFLAGIAEQLTLVTLYNLTADPVACVNLRSMANVRIYECHEVIEFLGTQGFQGLRAKSTKDGQEIVIEADGAFEYIGLQPTTEAFAHLGILDEHGYIITDTSMKTKAFGVFSAGDVNSKDLRQVITACSDGAIAAQTVVKHLEKLKL